jgi:hypothetical protein
MCELSVNREVSNRIEMPGNAPQMRESGCWSLTGPEIVPSTACEYCWLREQYSVVPRQIEHILLSTSS